MSKIWKTSLYAVAMSATLMLMAGCSEGNKPGDGGEPTAPPPAGTNVPSATTPGTTTGGPSGANIPGGK